MGPYEEVFLFSSRGRQITDEWMQGIMGFAYVHHVHDISVSACQRASHSLVFDFCFALLVCAKRYQ